MASDGVYAPCDRSAYSGEIRELSELSNITHNSWDHGAYFQVVAGRSMFLRGTHNICACVLRSRPHRREHVLSTTKHRRFSARSRTQKPGASAAFASDCTACKTDDGKESEDKTSKQEEDIHQSRNPLTKDRPLNRGRSNGSFLRKFVDVWLR
jgi:hypothetical protein